MERGFRVTGVDLSPVMILHAARNVPKARFLVADAAHFRTRARFEAAVSTFDSLNHILEPESLRATFRNVAAVLTPGGLFAFDILLEGASRQQWQSGEAIIRDDHILKITGDGFDPETGLATCRLALLRKRRGKWRRTEVAITERFYVSAEVDRALCEAGFERADTYDARDLGVDGELGSGRVWFVAGKGRRP